MNAVPTFKEIWFKARHERRAITAIVLMGDDSIRTVRIGPNGGWAFAKK